MLVVSVGFSLGKSAVSVGDGKGNGGGEGRCDGSTSDSIQED